MTGLAVASEGPRHEPMRIAGRKVESDRVFEVLNPDPSVAGF